MNSTFIKEYAAQLGLTCTGIAPAHLPEPAIAAPVCPLASGYGPERYDLTGLLPGCRRRSLPLFSA